MRLTMLEMIKCLWSGKTPNKPGYNEMRSSMPTDPPDASSAGNVAMMKLA